MVTIALWLLFVSFIFPTLIAPEINSKQFTSVKLLWWEVDEAKFILSEACSADKMYYWRMRAINDGTNGLMSEVRSFATKQQGNTNTGGDTGDATKDRQALMELYSSTGGDQWKNNSGWGQGAPSGSWHGVEVDSRGRVVRLDLHNNGLQGQLPKAIGNLNALRYLNVKKNNLSGKIPSAIGDMAGLEWLILGGRTYDMGWGRSMKEPPQNVYEYTSAYHPGKHNSATNDFSGTIPTTVGKLSNLKRLEISGQTNLKGPIPSEIGKLTGLEGLYLNYNGFTGTSIPSSLANLTNLGHLYLANDGLTGEIPDGFSNLVKLTRLHLGTTSNSSPDNELTGSLPDFSGLTKLQKFSVHSNHLTGDWPAYWNNGNFTDLIEVLAGGNNFTGTMHNFDKLPRLRQIAISGNNLTGGVDWVTTINHGVKIIAAGWNNFSGELPQSGWPDFGQLKTLYLNNNGLSGAIPCNFWNKIDNPRLGIAWISNNNFSSNCTCAMNNVKGAGNPDIRADGNNF